MAESLLDEARRVIALTNVPATDRGERTTYCHECLGMGGHRLVERIDAPGRYPPKDYERWHMRCPVDVMEDLVNILETARVLLGKARFWMRDNAAPQVVRLCDDIDNFRGVYVPPEP